MKCSFGISDFLEEISSLSHSVVFLYFFALIAEGFLISSCYSLELCVQMLISFLFSFAFRFCSFLLPYNKVNQLYGSTHLLPMESPSLLSHPLGHPGTVLWVPCSIRQV